MVKAETKEETEAKPDWLKMKSSEVESLVVDLGKKGNHPAKIGLVLRDQYGVPKAKLFNLKISKILKSNNIIVPAEKERLSSKMKKVESHLSKNKNDKASKRSLARLTSPKLFNKSKISFSSNRPFSRITFKISRFISC